MADESLNIQQQQALAIAQAKRKRAESEHASTSQEKTGIMSQAGTDFTKAAGEQFQAGITNIKAGNANPSLIKGAGQELLGGLEVSTSPIEGAANVIGAPVERSTGIPAGLTNFIVQMVGPASAEKLLPALTEMGPSAAMKIATKLGWVDEAAPTAKVAKAAEVSQNIPSSLVKSASSAAYKEARELGGELTPKFSNDLIVDLKELKPPSSPIAEELFPERPAIKLMNDFATKAAGKSLSLNDIDRLDKELTAEAFAGGRMHPDGTMTAEGQEFLNFQGVLRDSVNRAIENPESGYLGGEKAGFEKLKQAVSQWREQRKMADLEAIAYKAQMMDRPDVAFKTGVRSYLSNAKRSKALTGEERKALENLTQSTLSREGLRALGSRLATYAAMAAGGSPAKEAATLVGSHVARKVGAATEGQKLQDIINSIGNKALGKTTPAISVKPLTKAKTINQLGAIGAGTDLSKTLDQIQ